MSIDWFIWLSFDWLNDLCRFQVVLKRGRSRTQTCFQTDWSPEMVAAYSSGNHQTLNFLCSRHWILYLSLVDKVRNAQPDFCHQSFSIRRFANLGYFKNLCWLAVLACLAGCSDQGIDNAKADGYTTLIAMLHVTLHTTRCSTAGLCIMINMCANLMMKSKRCGWCSLFTTPYYRQCLLSHLVERHSFLQKQETCCPRFSPGTWSCRVGRPWLGWLSLTGL